MSEPEREPARLADSPRVLFPPPFVYVGFVILAWWIDRRWPLHAPLDGTFARFADLLGALCVGLGLALDLWALFSFARARTSALPFRPAAEFVVRGPYRFTRNPMYLGLTLLVIGLGLTTERLLLIPAALLAAIVIDRTVIAREEPYLERRFGDSYREYTRRVRRWI